RPPMLFGEGSERNKAVEHPQVFYPPSVLRVSLLPCSKLRATDYSATRFTTWSLPDSRFDRLGRYWRRVEGARHAAGSNCRDQGFKREVLRTFRARSSGRSRAKPSSYLHAVRRWVELLGDGVYRRTVACRSAAAGRSAAIRGADV